MKDIKISQIVKTTRGQRPIINVPVKIAKEINLDNTYIQFILYSDNTLDLKLTDSEGNEKPKSPDEFQSKILQNQMKMLSNDLELLETVEDLKNKIDELKKENQELLEQKPKKITPKITPDEEEEDDYDYDRDYELIPISKKDPDQYKYVMKILEQDMQDLDLMKEKFKKLTDGKIIREPEEAIPIMGYNLVSDFKGETVEHVLTEENEIDWEGVELTRKGDDSGRVPIAMMLEPRIYTFVRSETGFLKRIPLEEFKLHEKEALYQFINCEGKTYNLDYEEKWFELIDDDAGIREEFRSKTLKVNSLFGMSIERILSDEMYQKFKKNKIWSSFTERFQY